MDKCEPGAARFGNFPDYYSFNSTTERMSYVKLLSNAHFADLKSDLEAPKIIRALDIGCNTGDLTIELYQWLTELIAMKIDMKGVDLDANLVQCARTKYSTYSPQVTFENLNVMTEALPVEDPNSTIIFCFSVTLWIHINHGDDGLQAFLMNLSKCCRYLLLEAQPWKCYRTAARRAKRAMQPPFPFYEQLKIRGNVTEFIDSYLTEHCSMRSVAKLGNTGWNRDIVFYEKVS